MIALSLLVVGSIAAEETLTNEEKQQAREHIEKDLWTTVTIDSTEFTGRSIHLRGQSTSVNAIANFIENIRWDPLFTVPEIGEIRQQDKIYVFDITFSVKSPAKPDRETPSTSPRRDLTVALLQELLITRHEQTETKRVRVASSTD